MATDIISLVESIPDRQPASVTLTDTTGQRFVLTCVFKESKAPSFFLLFSGGTLPERIDTERLCPFVSRNEHGESVTFAAAIVELQNNRVIELVAKKSIRPEDLREYFRINIKAKVEVYYDPKQSEVDVEPLELKGETVDLSQTGVLTILSEECKISKPLTLELNLPNPAQSIICSGYMIRSKRIRKDRWLTSFHFDNISSRAREIIAKNCFAEQRRQLRENIQTAD